MFRAKTDLKLELRIKGNLFNERDEFLNYVNRDSKRRSVREKSKWKSLHRGSWIEAGLWQKGGRP